MTTYNASAVSDTVIAHKKGITLQQARALRDNMLAIAENDASVPTALRPKVLLGTAAASGVTVTLSSLNLSTFSSIIILLDAVSVSSASGMTIAGTLVHTFGSGGETIWRYFWIDLATGIGTDFNTSISTATTSISFYASTAFDAGTFRIWGVK